MPNAWTRPEALAAIFRCVGRRSGKLNLFWRTRHMDMKRRDLLGGATLAAAWAAGGVDIANDAFAATAPAGKRPDGEPNSNKHFLRKRPTDVQMNTLHSTHTKEAGQLDGGAQSHRVGFKPKNGIFSHTQQ